MFHPYPAWVGLRFSRAHRNKGMLSLVSLLSTAGVALGVAVLILALSVINGSIGTLRDEALKSTPHAVLNDETLSGQWLTVIDAVGKQEGVVAVTPNIEGDGTLVHQGKSVFARIRGIDPRLEYAALNAPTSHDREVLARLADTPGGIVLAPGLAAQLGIFGSAEVRANALSNLLGRRLGEALGLQVVGYLDFGLYGNTESALVNLDSAQSLFAGEVTSPLRLRLKVSDPMQAADITQRALRQAGFGDVDVTTWQQAQASLFRALSIEKYTTGFMLLMIVAIGAVNIVSTLVMAVGDKRAEVAILRSMGASRQAIMAAFITQGMTAGLLGVLIGAGIGVLLAANLQALSLAGEDLLGSLTGANISLLSHLKTVIVPGEVLSICLLALLISFLATLYPAYRASVLSPADTLRYE